MKQLRLKIYEVIEPYQHSRLSKVYDYSMLGVIILSLISLTTRLESPILSIIDKVTVSVFILDYLLRWITADYKMPKTAKWKAFLFYPFTIFAIIDIFKSHFIRIKTLKISKNGSFYQFSES